MIFKGIKPPLSPAKLRCSILWNIVFQDVKGAFPCLMAIENGNVCYGSVNETLHSPDTDLLRFRSLVLDGIQDQGYVMSSPPRQRIWNMTHISPHSHINKWWCHWPQLFHSYCCQPQVEWDHFETRNSLFMRNTWIVFILILNSVSTHTPLASHISVVLSFLACGFPNLLCTSGKSRSFVGLIRVSFV